MKAQSFVKASKVLHDCSIKLGVTAEVYRKEKDPNKKKVLADIMDDYSKLIAKQNRIIAKYVYKGEITNV